RAIAKGSGARARFPSPPLRGRKQVRARRSRDVWTCKRGVTLGQPNRDASPSLGFARAVWQTPNRANPFSPARGEKDRGESVAHPRRAVGRASRFTCDSPALVGRGER